MRSFIAILFSSIFLFSCTADTDTGDTMNIVTSFYPLYIFTLNVIDQIDSVKLHNMTPSLAGCLHDYQLSPNDMKLLFNSDLFIINGAGMESFLDNVKDMMDSSRILEASSGIELIGNTNPHVWLSIDNAICEVRNICDALSKLNPEKAERYFNNMNSYVEKLDRLNLQLKQDLCTVKGQKVIIFHESLAYLAYDLGMDIVSIINFEPNSEPGCRQISSTIKMIQNNNVSALLVDKQYPCTYANIISEETGVQIYTLNSFVTGCNAKEAYENTMLENKMNISCCCEQK